MGGHIHTVKNVRGGTLVKLKRSVWVGGTFIQLKRSWGHISKVKKVSVWGGGHIHTVEKVRGAH